MPAYAETMSNEENRDSFTSFLYRSGTQNVSIILLAEISLPDSEYLSSQVTSKAVAIAGESIGAAMENTAQMAFAQRLDKSFVRPTPYSGMEISPPKTRWVLSIASARFCPPFPILSIAEGRFSQTFFANFSTPYPCSESVFAPNSFGA